MIMDPKAVSLLALIAAFLGGCALTKETVDIAYQPNPNAKPVPGASQTAVRVTVEDQRSIKEYVSRKKNGYGMEMAPITTRESVPTIISRAIEAELKQRGFRTGSGGRVAAVQLTRFYSNYEIGFWSSTASAEVNMAVTVRGTGYTRYVNGRERNSGEVIMAGKGAREGLELALKDAIRQLFDDPAFVRALLRG